MKNIFFTGGIHGVGKGTICKKISRDFNLIHITASEILKWNDIKASENKSVVDINYTQNRLLNNLPKIILKEKNYLLDGHYCLLNSKNIPQKIEKETFFTINPKAFIIIVDDILEIKSRLENRDKSYYDPNMLNEFQELEIEYSKSLSTEMNIPLITVVKGNTDNLYNFLKNENIA